MKAFFATELREDTERKKNDGRQRLESKGFSRLLGVLGALGG
jgi:hypothetical protein